MIGSLLGPYRITASVGAGGMGEVYRATDGRLDREVAIKLLPDAFADDPQRLARLEREAKLLAALSHPNVAHVYGFERATLPDGRTRHFLAMELVPGEDLAERLKRGAVPVDEAIGIATQIAAALEAAHAKAIVHRDLKPANVKLAPDGQVKVLDFGLAKAYADEAPAGSAPDLSQSPTLAGRATGIGVILGTAAYMAPEQARGGVLDARADVWAFGVVLWEMLVGQKLFTGDTASDVLAGVLKTEIDLGRLPDGTPAGLRRLLRRCLVRDPRNRLHDIADARIELEAIPAEAAVSPARTPRRAAAVAVLLAVAGVALGLGLWLGRAPLPERAPGSFAFSVPPGGDGPAMVQALALSRDGRRLVLERNGSPSLWLREMGAVGTHPIPGTEGAEDPFLSPDGEWVGFVADGKLRKVALGGGDPIPICDAPGQGPGSTWGPDGTIYFTPTFTAGLFAVDADGGAPAPVTTPDRERGETGHMWPQVLPGGTALVFTIFAGSGMNGSRIAVLDLESRRYEVLFEGGAAIYAASGHLVYYRRGAHYAVPFDAAARRVTGSPRAVLQAVRPPEPTGDLLNLALSDTGLMASVPGEAPEWARTSRLAWISRDGSREPLLFEGEHRLGDLALSPDGQRVAVTRYTDGEWQVWIYDLVRGTAEQLTRDGVHLFPAWHPDGRHVGYTSLVKGSYDVWWSAIDESLPAEALIETDVDESAPVWSADGTSLVFHVYSDQTGPDLVLLRPGERAEPTALVSTPLVDVGASLSPDGRWIAYGSGDALYVSPFPQMGSRTLIRRGGQHARWSTRELFFVVDGVLMVARYGAGGGEFEVEPARPLFEVPLRDLGEPGYDVTRDGKRFLFFLPLAGERVGDEVLVDTDGFALLRGALPRE